MAVSEIFRIFNMVFVETSKAGCAFSLKIGIHMDEQGMLQGTRNKTGASQPLLSEGMVSSRVGPPLSTPAAFLSDAICDAVSYFYG